MLDVNMSLNMSQGRKDYFKYYAVLALAHNQQKLIGLYFKPWNSEWMCRGKDFLKEICDSPSIQTHKVTISTLDSNVKHRLLIAYASYGNSIGGDRP